MRAFHASIGLAVVGGAIYFSYRFIPKSLPRVTTVAIAVLAVATVGYMVQARSLKQSTRRILDEAALSERDLPRQDEQPLPILFANRRETIIGSLCIAVVLAVVVLSWAGVFERLFGE